jgi:hypothetical protein
MKNQTINADIVSKHLASCQRAAVIFFICMSLLVIAIDPISMTRSFYKEIDDDDYLNKTGQQNYNLFAFCEFTTALFLNLAVTCYLTVMLFFTSLSLMQIKTLQEYMITMIDTGTLLTDHYMDTKDKIISLKRGSYLSAQLLTIIAGINVICFMFVMWFESYYYINGIGTYQEMIIYDLYAFPYLLKGYTCHY